MIGTCKVFTTVKNKLLNGKEKYKYIQDGKTQIETFIQAGLIYSA